MPFLRNVPGLETVYRDYAKKGVNFFIVYKSIVHPGTNGVIEAFTKEERLKQLAMAKARLQTTVPMVSDSLDGAIVAALKSAPNAEFVVDKDGKMIYRKFWHDPVALRTFLEERLGKVDKPTRVADLNMKLVFPKQGAPRDIVKPLELPQRMMALVAKPQLPDEDDKEGGAPPFFAKLRAEFDRDGKQLYLGFYLDPVYQVHWNNPAGGLSFEVASTDDDGFEPITGKTPEYEHDKDVDPREFLVPFAAKRGSKFEVTVRYTICDDNGKFCMPVEQRYDLEVKPAKNGGNRAGDWMLELVGDPMAHDKDGDGYATRAELPKARAQIILLHYDRNHDDRIDKREAALFYDMIRMKPGQTGR